MEEVIYILAWDFHLTLATQKLGNQKEFVIWAAIVTRWRKKL